MWDNKTSKLNLLQSEYIQKRIHTFLQDLLDFIQLWNKVYKEKGPQLSQSFDLEKSGRNYIMVGVWIRHYNIIMEILNVPDIWHSSSGGCRL